MINLPCSSFLLVMVDCCCDTNESNHKTNHESISLEQCIFVPHWFFSTLPTFWWCHIYERCTDVDLFLVPYQVEQRGYAEVSVKSNVQKYISGQQLVKIHTHRWYQTATHTSLTTMKFVILALTLPLVASFSQVRYIVARSVLLRICSYAI